MRMCRSIKPLFNFEPVASNDEIHAAALQFVRKISGFTHPSHINEKAFYEAVDEIAHISKHLMEHLSTTAPPKNREEKTAKARARWEARH